MRLLFMGSSAFAEPSLRALAQHHDIAAVYCRAPQKAKRGQKLHPTAVHEAALAMGLPVRYPTTFKDDKVQREFADWGATLAVVVAYGLLLPAPILAAPPWGCLNLHASLLPRWRGAAPIARAIEAGDSETGLSLMRIGTGLDDGAIYAQQAVPIDATDTLPSLSKRLSELGAQFFVDFLAQHRDGLPEPIPQNEAGACYAEKIQKKETHIDWAQPAQIVVQKIHALAPIAWFGLHGMRVRVLAAQVVDATGPTGQIIDAMGVVACQHGAVQLLSVQREGKQVLPIAEFLRGHKLQLGTQLD